MMIARRPAKKSCAVQQIEGRGRIISSARKVKGGLMMRSGLSRRARVAIVLSAAAGAIISPVVIASAGSAQDSAKTLRLVATAQQGVGFAPDREPRQGDRFGGGAKITRDGAGIQRTVCTVIGERGEQAICTIELQLTRGTLSAQGLVPQRADHTPIAITGGTGAYDGAGGTAVATQISQTETRFTVRLRP
jgi:hypothetical protein